MLGHSSRRSVGPVLAFIALTSVSAHAQAPDLSGQWEVRWAQGIRLNTDGSVEVQRWGDAELELARDGEQITGRWTTHVLERVEWRVHGTFVGQRLMLEATEHDSSNPELAIVERIVWDAEVGPEGIEGEVMLHIRGRDRPAERRPFTATPRRH